MQIIGKKIKIFKLIDRMKFIMDLVKGKFGMKSFWRLVEPESVIQLETSCKLNKLRN